MLDGIRLSVQVLASPLLRQRVYCCLTLRDPQVGPQGLPPPAGPPARHRRSTSVDVSSLIATRDGIGPARDYLAPAPSYTGPHHIHTLSHAHSLMQHSAPVAERDITALGHATAPPALEALRKAHPGMSIAQAVSTTYTRDQRVSSHHQTERDQETDIYCTVLTYFTAVTVAIKQAHV